MKKKKKYNNITELKNLILAKKNVLDVPEQNTELKEKKFKIGADFECSKYKYVNLIKKNEDLKYEKLKPDQYNMFKTFKYELEPSMEQRKILLNYCDGYIEMYNVIIKEIKDQRKKQKEVQNKNIRYCDMNYKPNITDLKKKYKEKKKEIGKKFNMNLHILDYSINDCITMFKSIVSNQKNGNIYNCKMRYLKKSKQYKTFKVEKQLCTEKSFCTSVLGKKMKIKPNLNYRNDCETVYTIQYDKNKNKFYLLRKIPIIEKELNKTKKIISIDPGIRTIITGISNNHVLELGKNVDKKLKKKLKKIKILKSLKSKNNIRRKIKRMENQIKNYMTDVHWKISNYLVKRYNHIVIGNFSTSHMKREKKGINLEVMKSMNMYKLREKIKYKCLKHKRKYIKINESYTTKICINCGEMNDIKQKKIYKCETCKKEYDRDIKSACCIYLKSIK